jgi:AP-1 complex subunit gamma-1
LHLLWLLLLQAAVPKYLSLQLEPASGSVLPGLGGSIRQSLRVTNSSGGAKGLVMRLRLNYSKGGQPVVQQVEVSNFPTGL